MKNALLATTMLVAAGAAHAQTTGNGTIDGLPYVTLTSPDGCTTAAPCTIVEYLHPLGEQDKAPSEIQRYFNTTAFWAANPHTIVVAPMIPGSSATNNWGDVSAGINNNMTAAVDLVQQTKTTVPTNGTTTLIGGSMGAIGGEQLVSLFGPRGSQQAGVYQAGLFYDGAPYQISPDAMKSTLCGIPLTIVHGANDTTVSPVPDQNMAQTLSGCPGFTFISVPGMGHGTYSGASIGLDNPQLSSQMIAAAQNGGPTTATTGAAAPTISATATSAATAPAATKTATTPAIAAATPTSQITPGSGSLTDKNGHVWKITSSGSITEDGQYTPGGGGTSALTIGADGTVYGQDNGHDGNTVNSGGWFTLSGDGQSWGKSAPPSSAADGTSAPGSSAVPSATPGTAVGTAAPAADSLNVQLNYACSGSTPNSDPTHGGFSTINGQILAADGTPFIAHGVNLYDDSLAQAMGSLLTLLPKTNFIRLNIGHYADPSTYKPFIDWATSHGIVVEIDDHVDFPAQAFSGARLATETQFYSAMASAYKTNPYVWFETQNEPQGGDITAEHVAVYNAVRNAGNTSPVGINPLGGGNPGFLSSMDLGAYKSMENVYTALHFYNWVAKYSSDPGTIAAALHASISDAASIQTRDGQTPVILDEFGDSTDGSKIDAGGAATVKAVLDSGYGNAAWTWVDLAGHGADTITNGGQSLTAMGQQLKNAPVTGGQAPGCNIASVPSIGPVTQSVAANAGPALVPQKSLSGISAPPGMGQ